MASHRKKLEALIPEKRETVELDLKPSAVLVPFFEEGGELHLLFTKRKDHLKNHGGQVSFPGGACENGEDAVSCALREAEEEVGIVRQNIEVIGLLDDLETITFFKITPVVGYLSARPSLSIEHHEVERVFSVRFLDFLKEEHWTKDRSKTFLGKPYPVYYFHGAEEVIWGATARIVRRLVRRYKHECMRAC